MPCLQEEVKLSLLKVRYNSGKEICKIKIEKDDGSTLEKWTVMLEDFPKVYRILKKKYGFKSLSVGKEFDWAK